MLRKTCLMGAGRCRERRCKGRDRSIHVVNHGGVGEAVVEFASCFVDVSPWFSRG